MSQDVFYCSKCNAAMGYRLDVLPEVWRESWRCYVCNKIVYKDHPRYDLARKAEKIAETSAGAKAVLEPAAEKKMDVSADQESVQESAKEPVQTELPIETPISNAEPVAKRKRGRPRKISI